MQIDHCLILAAGFGTRMGKIGEQLPKVLWPVFEKSLLELQVRYARSLGAKTISINLHHRGKEIHEFCQNKEAFQDVKFLWEEPEILDIGGAVHNLARSVGYKGRLLILNADQFFYLRPEEFLRTVKDLQKSPIILFNYQVNSSDGYNALEVGEDRRVKALIVNDQLPRDTQIETYTGNSLIDLKGLRPAEGKSKFFDSVANWKEREVVVVKLQTDYWDFGTVKRFWETSFRILEVYRQNSNHPFLRFLVQERALKTWKIGLQNSSYHSRASRVINLGPEEVSNVDGPMILLDGSPDRKIYGVCWKGICDEVRS